MQNEYPCRFYRDLSQWLQQWLIENVGDMEQKLPYDIDLKMVVAIIISIFHDHVKTIYRRTHLEETAEIFNISVDTIARAIKKLSN